MAFPNFSTTIVDMKTDQTKSITHTQAQRQSARLPITRARIGCERETMPIVTRDSNQQIARERTASSATTRRNEITRDADALNARPSRVMDAQEARQDGIVSRIHIRLKTSKIGIFDVSSMLCTPNSQERENDRA